MCGDAPSPPSGGIPGSPPGGSAGGTGLCCACPANGDVNRNGVGNYVTSAHSPTTVRTNKCRIAIQRTDTGGSVTITKSFSLTYSHGATEAAHLGTIRSALSGAMSAWQSAAASYRLIIEQPGCSQQKLTILYSSTIVASGGDVSVEVDNRPAETPALRSDVSGGVAMHFYINGGGDTTWTMTHETGHTFGLADEYTYNRPTNTAPTMTYKGADNPDHVVTLSTSTIPAVGTGQFAFDNATVMGKNGNNTFPDYLFYWVAIEVKKVLQDAGVTAVVKIGAP